ncbi:MAG TPA: hypothetical protein VJI75_04395 [Candidatus Nanoarchaeia archaeon]|nr:hypothetical protein [Candidatus Nanoarchaeia archaeon]
MVSRMIKSKKGIELSVNFLVMLLLAIVVFGMGIYLAMTFFGQGDKTIADYYDQFDQQVGELACPGTETVCLSRKSATVRRGEMDNFALTVKNVLGAEKDFKITAVDDVFVNAQGEIDYLPPDYSPLELYDMPEGRIITLKNREKNTIGIGVQVPDNAESGDYSITINIYAGEPGVPDSFSLNPINPNPLKIFIKVL